MPPKTSITNLRTEAQELVNSLTTLKKEFEELKNELLVGSGGNPNIKQKFETLIDDLTKNIEAANKEIKLINEAYRNALEGDGSLIAGIQNAFDNSKKDAQSISVIKDDLQSFYIKIFGQSDENGILSAGLKQELENRKIEADKFQSEQEKKYAAMFEKIEKLLSGATTVSLAKAYEEQKKSFILPNIIWSGIFICSILVIILSITISYNDGKVALSLAEIKDDNEAIATILIRLPIILAATWLGAFASKQQSQNKRLQQEYAHKEVLARSFEGYKAEIQKLDKQDEAKEIMTILMGNVVDMTSSNPSKTLDENHEDKSHPVSSLGSKILDKFFPNRNQ